MPLFSATYKVHYGILHGEMTLELRRAEASLSAARTVLAHAEREFARGEQLLSRKAISTQQHDDLRNAVDRARDEVALALVARAIRLILDEPAERPAAEAEGEADRLEGTAP